MNRTAVTVAVSVLCTLAAVHVYLQWQQPSATPESRQQDLRQRVDNIEDLVKVLAETRVGTQVEVQSAAVPTPPEPLDPAEAARDAAKREAGIRAGLAVIDQAIVEMRFTQQHAIELSIATADLNGPDHADVYARLSMAINEGRVRPDRNALTF